MSDESRPILNGRYELFRRIARGGMAEVFLARDQLLDRPVAVKVLFPEFASDPKFVERFRREAQSAANLNHPNIVAVYDWGKERGTYFIVMEYVEGKSLAQVIHEDGPLSEDRAVSIASDIAAGLAVAHRGGVVHRDIKPGNVLINPEGVVKVTDFGIARATNAQPHEGLTQTGAVMGTATYLSPEQAQGQQADPRSDLYSLSIVLYEMLTTRPPFSGDTPVAIAYKHVQEAPTPPSQVNPNISSTVESVVMRGLAKDPQHRYSNAEAYRADLQAVRQGTTPHAMGQTAQAAPPPVAEAPVHPTPVHQGIAVQPQAAATTMLPPQQMHDEYDDEVAHRTGLFVAVMGLLLAVLALLIFLFAQTLNDEVNPTPTTGEAGAVQVEIPDVIRMDAIDAERSLRNAGFEVEVVQEEDDRAPVGEVLRQTPIGGIDADEGSLVTITVAAAPGQKAMLSVLGQSEDDAKVALRALSFIVFVQREVDEDVDEGTVIGQNPPAGTLLEPGSTVELVVSTGIARVTVPDLEGVSFEVAEFQLAEFGLNVTKLEETSDEIDQGLVIRTEPGADTILDKGDDIVVVVSSGVELLAIPSVLGLSEGAAKDLLEATGFFVTVVETAVLEDSADVDKVISVSPSEGTEREAGALVTIEIARGTIPTTTTTTTVATTTSTTIATTTTAADS